MKHAPVLLLASVAALGCAPGLTLGTPAPPGATLSFDEVNDRIDVTEGVAAELKVWCPWGTCAKVRAVTDGPSIAQVYLAHLGTLEHGLVTRNATALVLVGIGRGQTMLHVSEGAYVHHFAVTVLPPKVPSM
jgi:hypothetical protein